MFLFFYYLDKETHSQFTIIDRKTYEHSFINSFCFGMHRKSATFLLKCFFYFFSQSHKGEKGIDGMKNLNNYVVQKLFFSILLRVWVGKEFYNKETIGALFYEIQ